MEIMKKLLGSLGRTWNKLPKSTGVIEIQQSVGLHGLITVTTTSLVLHSTPYHVDMPIKQAIALEGYTLEELVDQLKSMGYAANLAPSALAKGLGDRGATVLLEITNKPLIQPQSLEAFTSEVWQLLYPIARLLQESEMNTQAAINQMMAGSASGSWIDYWATFVNVRRIAGESDIALQKRVFMELTNLKTNNIAIQQMIQFALGSTVKVEDLEPSLFKVTVEADYINISSYVHQIINELRGAGIDYFLNYAKTNIESYDSYFKDRYNEEFRSSDHSTVTATMNLLEDEYGYYQPDPSFTLGRDELGDEELMHIANTIGAATLKDEATMIMQQASSEVFPKSTEGMSRDFVSTLTESIIKASEAYSVILDRYEDYFEPDISVKGTVGFVLHFSELGGSALLNVSDDRVQDRASMTLTTTGGSVVRTELFDY